MKWLRRLIPLVFVIVLGWPQISPVLADTTYVVQSGDSLLTIARKFGVDYSALIAANRIANPNFIYVGQHLVIPGVAGTTGTAPTPSSSTTYVVQAGDSLSKIARKFNVSLSALIAANGITNSNLVYVGQTLTIPGTASGPTPTQAAPAATPVPPAAGGTYVVQAGDTIYKIAKKFGVDIAALIAANGRLNPDRIYVGQTLVIPGGVPTATAQPTTMPTATATPVATPIATQSSTGYTSRGLTGDSFSIENTTAGINQAVWFNFTVSNPTDNPVDYAVLAAHTDVGPTAQSWTNATLKPHSQLVWRDHINFKTTGSYQVYLAICYGDKNACVANSVSWDRLSKSILVVIQ